MPLIRVLEVARRAGVTAIQFDGDENPGLGAGVAPLGGYKTFHVDGDSDPEHLGACGCRTFLLRAAPPATAAGPGRFSWRQARALSIYGDILIGGGLDPGTVGLAIEDARPRGVDVLSSISRAENSQITVRFKLERDSDNAAADVRDRVSRVRNRLPLDVEEPVIAKGTFRWRACGRASTRWSRSWP